MCGISNIENKDDPFNLFTEEEIERIIQGIYFGFIRVDSLDLEAFLKVARKLFDGVQDGYGKTFFESAYNTTDFEMLKALQENVYVFSAAKQYQQIRETSKLLTTGKTVTPYNVFQKGAREIFDEFNSNWLRTEYNSAIAQASTASQWKDIEKQLEQFPMLTYQTVGDARVRPTHQALDNISRPVSDNFWDIYMPPNGWNCRCTVAQDDEHETTDLSSFVDPDDVPDIFRFNSGKERIVFSPKHPYFDVAPRDREYARNNFGMPTG